MAGSDSIVLFCPEAPFGCGVGMECLLVHVLSACRQACGNEKLLFGGTGMAL